MLNAKLKMSLLQAKTELQFSYFIARKTVEAATSHAQHYSSQLYKLEHP